MRIKRTGASTTVIQTERADVLVSYETPVAAVVYGEGAYVTDKWWSRTTSKHISQWRAGREVETRPQSFFDALLEVAR